MPARRSEKRKDDDTQSDPGENTLAKMLCDARRDYCMAAHDAGLGASKVWWHAYGQLGAAQHRITSDGGFRRRSAYQDWLRASQSSGPHEEGANPASAALHDYNRAIEEIARAEKHEWETAHHAYQAAMSEANEAYAAATHHALKSYLARIQKAWAEADVAHAHPAGLARLAEEFGYAAHMAQSMGEAPEKEARRCAKD